MFIYIDLKTDLTSTSIRTTARYGIDRYSLIDAETGDFILGLPKHIQQIKSSGIIYEDKAISVRV